MVQRSGRSRYCRSEELESRSLLSINSPLDTQILQDPLVDPPTAFIGTENPGAARAAVESPPLASPLNQLPFDDSGLSPPGLQELTALPDLSVFNVRDFGAQADGVTDDTLAIRAAIAAAEAVGGGIIYLPAGDYAVCRQAGDAALFSGTTLPIFHIQSSNLVFIGDGAGSSNLIGYMPDLQDPETTWVNGDPGGYFKIFRFGMFFIGRTSAGAPIENIQFRSLTIDGQAGYTGNFTVGGNQSTGDGWDMTHKAIHTNGPVPVSGVLVFNSDLANWRGEIFYAGGTALQDASLVNTTVRSTNASAVSMSGSMLLHTVTIGGAGVDRVYNGVENLAFTGDHSIVRDSTIQFAGNGLALLGQDGSSATVERTLFRNNTRAILLSEAAPNVTVRDSEFVDLTAGAFIWSRLGLYPVELPTANFSNFIAQGNTFRNARNVFVLQGTSISGFEVFDNTVGINTTLFADSVGIGMSGFVVDGTTFEAGGKDYQSYSGKVALWTNSTRESGALLGSNTWTNNPLATEILFAPFSDVHLLNANPKPDGVPFFAQFDSNLLPRYPIGFRTSFHVNRNNWFLPVDPNWNSFAAPVHVTEGLTIELMADGRFRVLSEVNDPPSGTDRTVNFNEDSSYVFAPADFGFSDPNDSPANAFIAVRITTLSGAGTLTNNGTAVTAGQFISAADIAAGQLRFTPAANASGNNYASFTFQVQDDGGTANGGVDLDPTPNTITFNVTPVNDAPAGTNRTVSLAEDTTYTFAAVDFGFSDPNDLPANSLLAVRITNLPAAGQLLLNGNAVSAGQSISAANLASGLLRFVPAANASGSPYASFAFQVQDDGGTANGGIDLDPTPNTITFNVTSVNDPPAGINRSVSMAEDTSYTFTAADFAFSDPWDSPPNGLAAVRISALPGAGQLSLDGFAVNAGQFVTAAQLVAGALRFMPAAHAHGTSYASFTFQVQDNGGTASGGVDLDPTPNAISISVISVNDFPLGIDRVVTTQQNVPYTFLLSDFGFHDPADAPPNNFLAVRVTTLPSAGALVNNGSPIAAGQYVPATDILAGRMQFIPGTGASGAGYGSFTFQVQDDGGTANGGADLDLVPNSMTIDVSAGVSGLAGVWLFDEGAGGTAYDISGNGNHGTLQVGADYAAGQSGSSLMMTQPTNWVMVPHAPSLSPAGSITLAAWIAPLTSGTQSILAKSIIHDVDGFELSLSNRGKVFARFNQHSSGDAYRVDSISSYPTNGDWMHVAVTYDGSQIRLFINGMLQSAKSASFDLATNGLDLGIGADSVGSRGMRGRIDEALIASRAFTPAEIAALYSGTLFSGGVINTAPTVNAGSDLAAQVGVAVNLGGSASDDGLPLPATLSSQWSIVSGPGNVTFGNSSSPVTTATFSTAGIYVLRLTANDGNLTASDEVTIQVSPAGTASLLGFWNFLPGIGGQYPSAIGHLGEAQGGASVSSDGRLTLASAGQSYLVPDMPALQITQAITMAAWIKPAASGAQSIVKKAAGSSVDGFELALSETGKVYVRFNEQSSANVLRVDSTARYPTTGTNWVHVAATYDGATIRLYVNGQLEGSKAANFAIGTNGQSLVFGSGLIGQMDEVLLDTHALSAAEIDELYRGRLQPAAPANRAPTVQAGADLSVQAGTPIGLVGSASDDGHPNGQLSYQWLVISGPGSVNFANANSAQTTATFAMSGTYYLRLWAADGALMASDDLVVTVAPASTIPGVVGFWRFDESGITVSDSSGNLNHGSLQGGARIGVGHTGGGLLMSQAGHSLVVPHAASLMPTAQLTVAAWIAPVSKATQTVVSKASMNAVNGYELSLSNGGKVFVRFNQQSGGDSFRVDSATSYSTNGSWMHVAATYDGSTIRLFVNGVLEASKPASFAINANTLALGIGAEASGARTMRGRLDDVLIADRAFSPTEVAALFGGAIPMAVSAASMAALAEPLIASPDEASDQPVGMDAGPVPSALAVHRSVAALRQGNRAEDNSRGSIVDREIHRFVEFSTEHLAADVELIDELAMAILLR